MLFPFIMLSIMLSEKPTQTIKKVCASRENKICVLFKYTYQNRTAVIGRNGNIVRWTEK